MSSGLLTARAVAVRSIRLSRPLSTVPGPSSRKRCTPPATMVRTEALQRAEVEEFLRYMLENETAIAERAQFVPLNQTQIDDNLAKLDAATG